MSKLPSQNGNPNGNNANPGPLTSGDSTTTTTTATSTATSTTTSNNGNLNPNLLPNPHSRYAPYASHSYSYRNELGHSTRGGYRGGPDPSSGPPALTRYYHRSPRYQPHHSSYRPHYSGGGGGNGPIGDGYYYNRYRGRHYSSYEARQRERPQQSWSTDTGVSTRHTSKRFGRESPGDIATGYTDRMKQTRISSSTSPYGAPPPPPPPSSYVSRSLPSSSASSPSPIHTQIQPQSQPAQQVQSHVQTQAQQPLLPPRAHSRSSVIPIAIPSHSVVSTSTPARPLTPKAAAKFDMRESPFLYLTGLHKLKGKENSEYEEVKTVLKEGDAIDEKLSKERLKLVMNEVELALLSNQCEKDVLNVQLTQDNLDSLLLMQDT